MKKIKLGIIGAGWVARQHLEVIRAIDWIEAVGITSRTFATAEALAKEYSIPCCRKDADSMVKSARPDALMVLVSEDQMYSATARALEHKLPLFIEKPAGLLPVDNLALAETAKRHSIPNMVGFNRRYYSIFHKGIALIREKGPLFGVSIEGHERIWRVHELGKFPKSVIDNWVFANSTHTIDLLRFFGGEPKSISQIAVSKSEKRGDQFAAIMELESGAIGQYNAYWHSPGGWRVVLYGDGITVEFKPLEKGIWTDKEFKSHEIIPDEVDTRYKVGFYKQMEAFGNLTLSGKKEWPMLDLEGSYKTMQLAENISSNVSSGGK